MENITLFLLVITVCLLSGILGALVSPFKIREVIKPVKAPVRRNTPAAAGQSPPYSPPPRNTTAASVPYRKPATTNGPRVIALTDEQLYERELKEANYQERPMS